MLIDLVNIGDGLIFAKENEFWIKMVECDSLQIVQNPSVDFFVLETQLFYQILLLEASFLARRIKYPS